MMCACEMKIVATVPNFEVISDNFKAVGICSSRTCAQKWISNLYLCIIHISRPSARPETLDFRVI
jgi:hypothetical protein